ncbi:metal ABC transporter solute-binding protein, Zn/Mn family [Bifidobacterium samirii]|uniref:ABC transporter substrate-binding protein n=1 Tax=Bifidobacterium samirii TaxID=2306974 RepID=A0A430FVW9_9BIFI|nr:zinc ABC transporter substrate-binding protein [Bifidobacterium samirii]RSX58140.1 ABC transporter substrate-binding protein [Bifidobacterium samirii]
MRSRTLPRLAAAALAALAAVSLSACTSGSGTAGGDAVDLTVVASLNQWGSVAADLGGDHVAVTSILDKASVDAHDYEPTTRDVAGLAVADVAVVNGAGYDAWAAKAAQGGSATLVDAADAAGIADGENPHVWFSSAARTAAADAITAAYAAADPDHAADYESLNKAWHEREDALESRIAEARDSAGGSPYAAVESVAAYLADDLGLEDVTPTGYAQAAANEGEPTPADIKDFRTLLTDGEADLLVVNTQESSSIADQLVAAAKTGEVPTVELTEQMPDGQTDLLDWIGTLVDDFIAALSR